MKKLIICLGIATLIIILHSCNKKAEQTIEHLRIELTNIANEAPAKVGIAIITDNGDTASVNNYDIYPLMSVFKLHEAVALGRTIGTEGIGLDTMIYILQKDLNPNTWSPMAKDHTNDTIPLTLAKILNYMLVYSDNNASNIIFDRIVSVAETDSIIKSLDIDNDFSLNYTEFEMQSSHNLAYSNHSTPMACACLLRAVITDSLMHRDVQTAIIEMLGNCKSANDRIASVLKKYPGSKIYHRTGSGYVNEHGEIIAVNDVAYIKLTNGMSFTLAIMIKDYRGTQNDASALIARIADETIKILCAS